MKKGLLAVLGLMAVVLLSACGNKVIEVDNQDNGKSLDDMYGNVSFTLDELEVLEDSLFPVSYSFTTYEKEDLSISESGQYIYLPDDEYLLPIEKFVVNKEITSSEIKENGLIYTMVDATLDGGTVVPILYINDPESLKYYFATVYGEKETTLFTFNY